ncbi:MAG: metallophosphatase family protein [Phycisphaerae bacterium]|nr:metallophosphatase family protein [Phycisphaerae bacterium]
MKIGILSDSHGQLKRLKSALEALQAAGAEALVHCGDHGSVECLAALAAPGLPCYTVAGNMDRSAEVLADAAKASGVCFDRRVVIVPLGDGRTLAAAHGNDAALLRQLVSSGRHAYVCCGHAHKFSDQRAGPVRVINPGALYHCRPYTVAVLDTATDELHVLTL